MSGLGQNNVQKLDAAETAFFKRQQEFIKSRTYDKKYKTLKSKLFIPVNTETPSGTPYVVWYSWDRFGVAKIISDYAHDFPRVDVFAEENQSRIRGMGASYGYSIVEIRRAQRAGTNLTQKKAIACRDAHERKQDNIAWYGDTDFGLQGFFEYPGITEYTVPVGASTTKTWASKTPDEIVLDLTGIMNAVSIPTNGLQQVNQILIDRANYNIAADTRMTDGNDKTILNFFKANHPEVMVDVLDELAGAGVSSTNRFFAYEKDLDVLEQDISQPFEQFEADKKGMEYEIPCHSETGGVRIFRPQAVAFGDGI